MALSFPLSDTDLWWHLAAGRSMVEAQSWLRADPFCRSSAGTPWIDLHWGFQLLVLGVHHLGGDALLVATRIGLVLAAWLVALRGRLAWDTAALACLLVFATRLMLDLRPLLVTIPCLVLLWNLVEDSELDTLPLLGCLGLQLVLANVQGLFLLGPLACAASAAGRWLEHDRSGARRRFALVAGLVLVSVVNPYGIHAFDLARLVASRIVPSAGNLFSREIPENLPLLSWILQEPARGLPLAWAAFGIAFLWRGGTGSRSRALLLVGALLLAMLAIRNLPLLAVACLLSVRPKPWQSLRMPAGIAVSTAVALSISPLLERRWNLPDSWIAPLQRPSDSTFAILRASPGAVFHELRAGGWLSWVLDRPGSCWADTRLVLHDAAFVRNYLDVLDHPDRFDSRATTRGFRYALLPVASWPRDRPLLVHLLRSPSWRLRYCDGAWALLERRDATPDAQASTDNAPLHAVDARIASRFRANPRLEAFVRSNWRDIRRDAGIAP